MQVRLGRPYFAGPCSVGDAGPGYIRPLGAGEHFFHLYAQVWPVHFCLCAEVDGWVRPDALRAAANQVRKRHPVLRTCIVDDALSGTAFYRFDAPLPVEMVAVGKDGDWLRTVECELRKPMPGGASAPLRLTAVYAPETTAIILTFQHAVADGMSGVCVLRDLMRALAGERLQALPFSPALEEKVLGSSAVQASTCGRIAPIPPTLPVVSEDLQPQIATAEFSAEETAGLLKRCRANETTMHGAICAAASRHLPTSGQDTIRMVSPIDLRKVAGIEDDVCGVFVGVHSAEMAAGGAGSIWYDAGRVTRGLAQSRSPDAVRGFLRHMSAEFPPTAPNEKLQAFFSAAPQDSLVISNLGALPIAEQYGPYALRAVWGPAMLTNLPAGRQTLGVSTFAGRLRLVHQSYRPIAGFAMAVRKTLLAACG